MKFLVKNTLYDLVFVIVKFFRVIGLISEVEVKICISTTKNYAERTLQPLLESLLNCGIKSNNIFIFEGGHRSSKKHESMPNYYFVDHNSFDLTALIEVCQLDIKTDYWFLLHDTCVVDKRFNKRIHNIPLRKPDVMPIKYYPSMNMGAYSADFLNKNKDFILSFKNQDYSIKGLMALKELLVRNEDIIFKQADLHRTFFYNQWKVKESQDFHLHEYKMPEFYKNRICEYFEHIGIIKFKANYKVQQKRRINL